MTSDDDERWREFVARAREIFDLGDAWAAEQADPEGVPVFEGAESWTTAPLRLACVKGRLALDRGDVGAAVIALVEAGHAGRDLEFVKRWLRTFEAIDTERRRRAGSTLIARKAARDRDLFAKLAEAPATYRKNPHAAATWLRDNEHIGDLTRDQVYRRLRKGWDVVENRPAFL
jgi:hypothetical protein